MFHHLTQAQRGLIFKSSIKPGKEQKHGSVPTSLWRLSRQEEQQSGRLRTQTLDDCLSVCNYLWTLLDAVQQ